MFTSRKWLVAAIAAAAMAFSTSAAIIPIPPLHIPGTGTIAGTATDSLTGWPVDSVKVVLLYVTYSGTGQLRLIHTTRQDSTVTDANGAYQFSVVDTLTFSNAAFSPRYLLVATNADYDTTYTAAFGVADGQTTTENIVMPSLYGAIAGTVTDTVAKKAVGGAKVVLLKRTCSPLITLGCTTVRMDSTVTDSLGRFAISDVPALLAVLAKGSAVIPVTTTTYLLEVSAAGYQTAESGAIAVVNKTLVNADVGLAPTLLGVVPLFAHGRTPSAGGMVTLYDVKGRIVWRGATVDGRIQVPESLMAKGIVFIAEVRNAAGISTSRICRVSAK